MMLILAVDGLDYYLVKKFKLKNLLQTYNKKIRLKEFSQIITHPIWATIISGKLPQTHGMITTTKWKNPIIQFMNEFLSKRTNLEKKEKISRNMFISNLLTKLGFKKTLWNKLDWEKRGIQTIFDKIKNSKAISVPTWNEDHLYQKIRAELVRSIGNLQKMRSLEEILIKDWGKKEENLREEIKKSYDLIFCYFIILDAIGHMYRGNLEQMKKYYKLFDDFISRLKKDFKGKLMIISDHGMVPIGKYGDHSKYMFFSSNFRANPKSIIEISKIIEDCVLGRPYSERE